MPYFRSERLHAPAFHQKDQSFLTHMKNASLIHVLSMSPEKCKHCVLSKMNVTGLNYQSMFYFMSVHSKIRYFRHVQFV